MKMAIIFRHLSDTICNGLHLHCRHDTNTRFAWALCAASGQAFVAIAHEYALHSHHVSSAKNSMPIDQQEASKGVQTQLEGVVSIRSAMESIQSISLVCILWPQISIPWHTNVVQWKVQVPAEHVAGPVALRRVQLTGQQPLMMFFSVRDFAKSISKTWASQCSLFMSIQIKCTSFVVNLEASVSEPLVNFLGARISKWHFEMSMMIGTTCRSRCSFHEFQAGAHFLRPPGWPRWTMHHS